MEFYESQAIYLQIADLMCEKIILKHWPINEKIPSVRQMAVELEVNPNTTMRTFAYLQDQDIIYNKRGIGYFVSEIGVKNALALLKQKFLKNELPRFVKAMNLLQLSFDDLKTIKPD